MSAAGPSVIAGATEAPVGDVAVSSRLHLHGKEDLAMDLADASSVTLAPTIG